MVLASSVSEPVFGSDIEREPKSDFKQGRKFVFYFGPRELVLDVRVQSNQSQFLYIVVLEEK